MAAYGKAHDALAADAEYQKLMNQAVGVSELKGRTIVVGVDL